MIAHPQPDAPTRGVTVPSPAPEPDSPFGNTPPTAGGKMVWIAALAAILVLAITVVLVLSHVTAHQSAPAMGATASAQSEKGTSAAGDDRAPPISLSPAQQGRIGVTFTTATLGLMSREVRAVAQVTFDETRVKAIAPKLDGWVDKLYVDATGQPVRAGDALFSIYSPMLVTAQEELLLAKRLSADVQQGTSDAVSGASGLIESARRRLQYWDIAPSDIARLEQTGQVQKTLILRSPVSGVVLEKNVLAGQKIMAGEAIYKVADLSTVWIEGQIYEQDLPLVRIGATVSAEFEALPGERRTGRITYIYPTLNPETRTARVRVALTNPGLALKPGMYATLLVNATSATTVLSVPRAAVLETGQRTLVFVQRADGMLEPRDVVLGTMSADRAQVLRGLAPGEKVVGSATFLVDAESNLGSALGGMGNMPGMDVRPKATRTPAAPGRPQDEKR